MTVFGSFRKLSLEPVKVPTSDDLFGGVAADLGACCRDGRCQDDTEDECVNGPTPGIWKGPFTSCSCFADVDRICRQFGGLDEACCFGDSCVNLQRVVCESCGGVWSGPGRCQDNPDACGPPPPEPTGCRKAVAERKIPEGKRSWTTDACANARFRPAIRSAETEPTPADEDFPIFREGMFETVTDKPARMAERIPGSDQCVNYYGLVAIDVDGYAVPIGCNRPYVLLTDDIPMTKGEAYIQDDEENEALEGYAYFAVPYRTPPWTELVYASPKMICERER